MRSEEYLLLVGGLGADRVCPDFAGAFARVCGMFACVRMAMPLGLVAETLARRRVGGAAGAVPLGLADKAWHGCRVGGTVP